MTPSNVHQGVVAKSTNIGQLILLKSESFAGFVPTYASLLRSETAQHFIRDIINQAIEINAAPSSTCEKLFNVIYSKEPLASLALRPIEGQASGYPRSRSPLHRDTPTELMDMLSGGRISPERPPEDRFSLRPPWTEPGELEKNRQILAEIVGAWLTIGGVRPYPLWITDRPGLEFRGQGLFGALAIELQKRIMQARYFIAFCSDCQVPYVRHRRPSRTQRNYCPGCGIKAAWRTAARKARARKATEAGRVEGRVGRPPKNARQARGRSKTQKGE